MPLTMGIKHRADSGFRKLSALIKLGFGRTVKCSEMPYVSYPRPLPIIKENRTKLKNLNFETISKDAEKFILTENDSYIRTYPEFLKYFVNIDQIEEHHLIIASHFVYGWMPTIIQLNLEKKDKVLFLLNSAKNGHVLNKSELEILKNSINNSLVGLSKLLHFINPRDYAIWDSRIFRYLTEKKSSYGIDKPENYLKYLNGLKIIAKHKDYAKLHGIIARNFDYEIHPNRAIEITMFETDRNKQQRTDKFIVKTKNEIEKIN